MQDGSVFGEVNFVTGEHGVSKLLHLAAIEDREGESVKVEGTKEGKERDGTKEGKERDRGKREKSVHLAGFGQVEKHLHDATVDPILGVVQQERTVRSL